MRKRTTTKRQAVPRPAPAPYVPPKGFEAGLTKNQILTELSRSPHGNLKEYVPVGQLAAKQEAEFLARLISWNRVKGQVRDSQVALPVVSLSVPSAFPEFTDNALAHIALLGPRELERAFRFAMELKVPGNMGKLRRVIERYLREREIDINVWNRVAIQHRDTLKTLYSLGHVKPAEFADKVLFKKEYPSGSVFEDVAKLKDMAPAEAASAIVTRKIPFLIALGALGAKAKEPDLVMALIERMSPTELVTNTAMLEKLGMKGNPVLRGAYEKALEKASKSKKNVLKTTRAAEAIGDSSLKAKLQGLQDRQIAASSGIEGNWLVLADKSGSMSTAIEIARQVAATLAKFVKGKVHLVFFNTMPTYMDVTGKSLDEIKLMTKYITADGGTSIGCGLQRMLDSKEEVDGIAIVSDGGDNTPPYFHDVYPKYNAMVAKDVPVYFYKCVGDSPHLIGFMKGAGIDIQTFDMCGGIDFYSLPNLIQTMRTNRYSLIEEVMAAPLLTLDKVFKSERKEEAISA